jgi:hypothetical protein
MVVARQLSSSKPLPFRGGVGVGASEASTFQHFPTPDPSPEGEGGKIKDTP